MNWIQTTLNNKTVNSLTIYGTTIFAGTVASGVYLSNDNGTSWTQTALNNRTVNALAVSGTYIFAGTINYPTGAGEVYISTNNGTSWTVTALYNKYVYSLAVSGSNIFAGTYNSPLGSGGVYLSTNNGTNWTQTILNNKSVYSLAASGNNIFAGTDSNGVFLSTNNGISWINKNQGFSVIPSVSALLIIGNTYIFAGTQGQSVWLRLYTESIGIKQISEVVPSSYSLQQNYPNPFNPTTKIQYAIPHNGIVKLVVFDALGRVVETLVNENQTAGVYETEFNASRYSSGVYFYKLTTGNFSETKKMTLIK
ncbi:T9SS C-terminal target domain-containing protein [bacterium]|nr:MAG: T9SS C-terminal target domain-containing protein [bacterium]